MVAPELFAWGLARLVETAAPALALAGVSRDLAAYPSMDASAEPDVVVVHVETAEANERLLDLHGQSRAKILAVGGSADDSLLDAAILAGARGWVRASDPPDTLLRAIEKVHQGEVWLDRGATGRIFVAMARQQGGRSGHPEQDKIATLTRRERQTVAALTQDSSANGKRLAERLHISENTLRNHLTSIYSKLGLSNRVELYAFAQRHKRQLVD